MTCIPTNLSLFVLLQFDVGQVRGAHSSEWIEWAGERAYAFHTSTIWAPDPRSVSVRPPPLQQHRLSPVSVPECVSLGSGNTDLGGLNNIRTVCSSPSLYSASLPLGAGFAWSLTASLLRLDSEGQGFFFWWYHSNQGHINDSEYNFIYV